MKELKKGGQRKKGKGRKEETKVKKVKEGRWRKEGRGRKVKEGM